MDAQQNRPWDAVIVGGGLSGLSAAIYLARAERKVLVVDSGKSMARWEPDVQNYLGFPGGIGGQELLSRGREQAENFGAEFVDDTIGELRHGPANLFHLLGPNRTYEARRVLIATGIFHLPPEIHGVSECLGHSMFFCKDCDGFRCRDKTIGVFGWNNEAVEYALAMIVYSPCVFLFLNGHAPRWSGQHERWLRDYEIPIYSENVVDLHHVDGQLLWLELDNGNRVELEALFTTRGDVYNNKIARQIGAETNDDGEIVVDASMQTTVHGVYASGCVTPANCQMIIAAGQGAVAGQAINRSLFEESLATHSLHRYRSRQLQTEETEPRVQNV